MQEGGSPTPDLALEAAYRCLCRLGLHRTSMSDIVQESGLSRPTIYKYLGSTKQAFRRLIEIRLETALASAATAAEAVATPELKVLAILGAKLDLAITLWADAPFRAFELLSTAGTETPELLAGYMDGLRELLIAALQPAVSDGAREVADVLLTFTRGLEDELTDPDVTRAELAAGVRYITRGAIGAAAA